MSRGAGMRRASEAASLRVHEQREVERTAGLDRRLGWITPTAVRTDGRWVALLCAELTLDAHLRTVWACHHGAEHRSKHDAVFCARVALACLIDAGWWHEQFHHGITLRSTGYILVPVTEST